jgi:hypothetical protein
VHLKRFKHVVLQVRPSKIGFFSELIRDIKIKAYRAKQAARTPEEMFRLTELQKTAHQRIQPVLSLVPEPPLKINEDKSKFITFELKVRAGQPAGNSTYKKYVRVFEEGSPQQWIDLAQDLREIWTQNTINGPSDRTATVRSLLKGETLTAFESALLDARMEDMEMDGEVRAATVADIEKALSAVAASIFPHRALEIQRLWMTRGMKKPYDMPFRKAAALISKINNSLPLFPGGTDESKFSDQELVGLMEWSLPSSWRAKFDLDSYIPTLGTKAKLISECEAIERNEFLNKERKNNNNNNNKKIHKKTKFSKFVSRAKLRGNFRRPYFCRKCGPNNTHATPECRILKRTTEAAEVEKNGVEVARKTHKPFTPRGRPFKEAHATSKQAGNKKSKAVTRKADRHSSDSSESSDSAMSVNNMEFRTHNEMGTLGLENMQIQSKQEPDDWVHVEDESTSWEEI